MHLIKALAAGVLGAESGTALLYRRGTSTRVAYYSDFEGLTSVSATTAVTLDANGGATVYTDEVVDVIVLSSLGVQVRRFVDGVSAVAVEVRSQSFTGTNYETAASAAREPTTLASALDLWLTSAGTTDWNVLVNGSAATLQSIVAGTYGVYFNVKSTAYGALGNGSTNDYTAIAAAIAAAAVDGGVVFFPPGTYPSGSSITVPANVSLLGAGSNASIIQTTHASANLITASGSPTYSAQFISGLTLRANVTHSGSIIGFTGTSKMVVRDCYIGGANSTAANGLISVGSATGKTIRFENCTLITGGAASKMVVSDLANRAGRINMTSCTFITPASLTHSSPTIMGLLQGCCFFVRDSLFDLSLSTAGTFSCIYPGAVEFGSVRGCEILDTGGATATVFALGALGATSPTAVWFDEDGNQLSMAAANVTLYSMTHSADGYYVNLGTRVSRYKEYAITGAGSNALDFMNYGVIAVRSTFAGVSTFTAVVGAVGSKTSLMLINSDASTRVYTLGTGLKSFGTYTMSADGGAGFEFTAMSPAAGHAWYLTGFSGANASLSTDTYAV